MNLKDVLRQIPGVNRRFVYYLESQGYIQPTRLPKERIDRRDYSEGDLRVIRETWKYYSRGFSLHAAHALAVKKQRAVTLVTFQAPHKRRREVLEGIKDLPEAVEAAAIYADSADFIVRFSTPQESDVYQALIPLFAAGVTGLSGLYRVVDQWVREPDDESVRGEYQMNAYLLIKAPSKSVGTILNDLKQFKEIVEASVIYGESDIIARVVTQSQQELDRLVMERVHGIPPVESTRTYVVVGDLHWSRAEETPTSEPAVR